MTSYVLAEEVDSGRASLDDMITVSRNAWSQNPTFQGSSLMWIEPGKPVSLEDLERGVVISSGNDASVAVAEHLAGTESSFVDVMNQIAADLGWIIRPIEIPMGCRIQSIERRREISLSSRLH